MTNLIERLEVFEEQLGVTFEGLFAYVDNRQFYDEHIHVNGEFRSVAGKGIDNHIDIIASIHDSSGRILDKTDTIVLADKFYCFQIFQLLLRNDPQVKKIRIYPKIC